MLPLTLTTSTSQHTTADSARSNRLPLSCFRKPMLVSNTQTEIITYKHLGRRKLKIRLRTDLVTSGGGDVPRFSHPRRTEDPSAIEWLGFSVPLPLLITILTSNRPVEDWGKLLGDAAPSARRSTAYCTTATCSSAAREADAPKPTFHHRRRQGRRWGGEALGEQTPSEFANQFAAQRELTGLQETENSL